MYKLPITTTGEASHGTEYFYIDKNSQDFENRHSNIRSEIGNPLYYTLRPLYTNVSKRTAGVYKWIIYDQI